MKSSFLALLFLLFLAPTTALAESGGDAVWYHKNDNGELELNIYFYWSENCPHCQDARPLIEHMAREHDWLTLHSIELSDSKENRLSYQNMAALFNDSARSVPAFFFCNTMLVGFQGEITGRYILERIYQCRQSLMAGEPLPEVLTPDKAALAMVTGIDTGEMSLPLLTLVIAGLDAFNPCAFFVLLFLLSILVHARNRRRILLIGGVFVFFSGLIYFLFMTAWLNVFLLIGPLRWVTAGAGLIAAAIALVNIKDYFMTGVGPTLSIPAQAKPGLFQRMRNLLHVDNMPALLLGTVVLAIAANSYELLCTTGLPMVYTRLLTLEQLPTMTYYLYLAAYNVIYVLPLLFIVLLFAITLGARKLQAHEGRVLKLLSGLMMLGLGMVLIFAPQLLSNVLIIFGIILSAVILALLAFGMERWKKRTCY